MGPYTETFPFFENLDTIVSLSTLPSPILYICHVFGLLCNIARCQVGTRVTLGNFLHKHIDCAEKFILSKPGINR